MSVLVSYSYLTFSRTFFQEMKTSYLLTLFAFGLRFYAIHAAVATQFTQTEPTGNGEIRPIDTTPSGIIGGTDAGSGTYPWFGLYLLWQENLDYTLCGSALIHSDIVVTAAHCQSDGATDEITLGERNPEPTTHGVTDVLDHPFYDEETLDNDIKLLKLDRPSSIEPVEMNTDPTVPVTGDMCTVMGHGTTESEIETLNLKETQVEVYDFEACSNFWFDGPRIVLPNSALCTSTDRGTAACSGDSGGPVISKDTGRLVGLVSFGSNRGCLDGPEVHTRVSSYRSFIQQVRILTFV